MRVVSIWTGCLNPPSKLEGIKAQLGLLGGKSTALQFFDNTQDNEDVSGLLEDLQEAINDYMVCSCVHNCNVLLDVDQDNRWCNKWQSMIKGAS